MSILTKSGLTVGVFGLYSARNFGDDLMALIICKHLESLNINYVLFSSMDFWQQYGINNTEIQIEAFVDKVDMVVYGGGGILQPNKRARGDSEIFPLSPLLDLCQQKSIPVYAISVGGSGVDFDKLPPISQRLVLEADYITFRNSQDWIRLKSNSKSGVFFHDIVWTTPYFFPNQRKSKVRKRIGINIYTSGRKGKIFKWIMQFIVKLRQECEFIFIHVSGDRFRAVDLSLYNDNCSKRFYSDLSKDIDFISSLDLFITCRLHMGVAAMSFGVPTICLWGSRKAQLLFQDIGLEHLVWRRDGYYKLIWYFSTPKRLNSLTSSLDNFQLKPIIENSLNHLIELTKIVTK